MLNSPEAIQKQLSDAISIIGKTDFPLKWPELIKQMVEKFATGFIMDLLGVILFFFSIFRRFSRYKWGLADGPFVI